MGVSVAVFPFASFLLLFVGPAGAHARYSKPRFHKRVLGVGFAAVALCWFLGWLAAFPGAYGQDAPYWYLEFEDPSLGISSQWSPVYAGLFYAFVSYANNLLGWYGYGLAAFTALQMLFILYCSYRVMRFVGEERGDVACILVAVFYAVVPTHMVMAVSTAQGAPFMACVSMAVLHFTRMALHGESYWGNVRNPLACIGWCIAAGVFRNNMVYALVVACVFLPLFKRWRKQVAAVLVASILGISLYSGPVLDAAGVVKGSSTREMMSLPLQQLAYVYNWSADSMSQEQRDDLLGFVTEDGLKSYESFPSISDSLKGTLDTDYLKENPSRFISLYLQVGFQAPLDYLKAVYTQDLGLLYLGKSYPDLRIWHHFLNYAGYGQGITAMNQDYIVIDRHSLFPAYDELLKCLFGHNPSGVDAAWGDGEAFASTPFLNVACRASTYFWILAFVLFFGLYRKWRIGFLPVALLLGITVTVLLAPVILYRYYAAVAFSIPVLLVEMGALDQQEP